MDVKFCKFCNTDHPLTKEYWNMGYGKLSVCKLKEKKYRQDNKDKINRTKREWAKNNPEKSHSSGKRNRNKPESIIKRLEYNQKNKTKMKEYKRLYNRKRSKVDINYKLAQILRVRLCLAIKNGHRNGSAVRDLGCSLDQLKQHIESKFQPGMTWENYGVDGWHIDHIIPLSSFDLSDKDQLKKACNYMNLQPLWARENLSKGCKLPITTEGDKIEV